MSILTDLLSGNKDSITRELYARGAYVVENTVTREVIQSPRLMEQRDAPDQAGYPLTRREVEKMLTKYERREDTSTGMDNPEARSLEGAMRARWYSPETSSDFVDEFIDGANGSNKNMDDRPSKLMPYDYKYTVHKPGDVNVSLAREVGDADTTNDKEDWSGEFNRYFTESADNVEEIDQTMRKQAHAYQRRNGKAHPHNWEVAAAHRDYHALRRNSFDEHGNLDNHAGLKKAHAKFKKAVEDHGIYESISESGISTEYHDDDADGNDLINLFKDSVDNSYPIEFHLDDGSFVSIEPHHAQHILSAGLADNIGGYMKSPAHFNELMRKVYPKAGEQHG